MITILLLLLPQSFLLYLSEFFFVYSVLFERIEVPILSQQSYAAFEYFSDAYAKKSLK